MIATMTCWAQCCATPPAALSAILRQARAAALAHDAAARRRLCEPQARAATVLQGRLQVRRRKRRHGVAVERRTLIVSTGLNQAWLMDSVSDALEKGCRLKCLTTADLFTYGIGGEFDEEK